MSRYVLLMRCISHIGREELMLGFGAPSMAFVSRMIWQEYCEESSVPFMSVVIDTQAFKYLLETQDLPALRPFHDMLNKARRCSIRVCLFFGLRLFTVRFAF